MEEMVYTRHRINPKRIAEGEYKGFAYYVLSLGTHPCAYIDVSGTKLHGIDYSAIDIECHGGLTYSRSGLSTVDKKGWYIGWDYAHFNDFAGYYLDYPDGGFGKKWTTEEIVSECKEVINQLERMLNDDQRKAD